MSAFRERIPKWAVLFSLSILFSAANAFAQPAPEKPKEETAAAPQEKPAEPPNAAQIDLLETKYRVETNGDSRKEVHALVKINSELGVRQFARLNFDYNRGFQSVEIPLVHVTHASGGTADILPSAITDAPNPAVEQFPAYHDVRVRSVRILGLQPGDTLEYRVITLASHHPLAPDFWLDHSFDRSGVVSHEMFTLNLPDFPPPQVHVNASVPLTTDHLTESARTVYTWEWKPGSQNSDQNPDSDIAVTTFRSWRALLERLGQQLGQKANLDEDTDRKVVIDLTARLNTYEQKVRAVYNFVAQKISTIDLPLGSTGFRTRPANEILASGYATAEDKFVLFNRMVSAVGLAPRPAFTGTVPKISDRLPRPSLLSDLLTVAPILPGPYPGRGCSDCEHNTWLDLTAEVAPFGVIPASLRGREALVEGFGLWQPENGITGVPRDLPFRSTQNVLIRGELTADGTLTARVRYTLRGDNELLLRVAFHRSPAEKQKELAQYLALSDGFRGKVTSAKTSDPYETDKPFEVEYELTQEKFVDWSKKPVRIPALLPLPGLPEAPRKPAPDAKIELGPPLQVDLRGTLRLPPGMTAQAPPGTSVKRDYASFTAEYSAKQNVIHFSRNLNFVSREISGARFVDFGAFLHAVQLDQSQLFILEKLESPTPAKPK